MIIDSGLANWINYIIEDVESVSHNEITLGLSILVGFFMSWFEFTQSLGMKMAYNNISFSNSWRFIKSIAIPFLKMNYKKKHQYI